MVTMLPSELAPTLATLRADYDDLKARLDEEPWLRARAGQAYERWFAQARTDGRRPDTLDRYDPDETARFFARVIQGADGHCYWERKDQRFSRNDGKERHPRKWWWEHVHGTITDRSVPKPMCGEPNCLTVDHQQLLSWSDLKRRYSDEQCAGALKVAALRLGHSPTRDEYAAMRIKPSEHMLRLRFSSWNRALEAAGLTPFHKRHWTDEECVAALRDAAEQLGEPPHIGWWDRANQRPARITIVRRFGSWDNALKAAGLS
jgi:hypothetical protein